MKIFIISFIFLYQALAMTGIEVMQKVEKQGQGFIGSEAEMQMLLIDAHGTQVERIMEASVLENIKEGDKSITAFIKPTDIKGTKLLTWTRVDDDNKQWLYLPKFKRVKKINSTNQAGSFMGSEFSYEDIGGQVLDKYNYKVLSEDKDSWMIESTPKKKSGYSKLVSKISKTDLIPLEVKYYDRRAELLKESSLSDFKTYKVGKKSFLMANKIEMKNLQTQKRSVIKWTNRKIGLKLKDNQFKSSKLK
jgi:outer membrane lipoprotein-sorting protein